MTIRQDIPYRDGGGWRTTGDLFLPKGGFAGDPVILIHGGGWRGLDKTSIEFALPFFLEAGHPVFNINYRLTVDAPWPACGDDCLAAAHFVLSGGLEESGVPLAQQLVICGASAGGHLAMMTGLRLPRENVRGIVSLAGPSRLDWIANHDDPLGMREGFLQKFFGRDIAPEAAEVAEASPALRREKCPPPLFCLHSTNDDLVPLAHAEEALNAWRVGGGRATLRTLDGHGNLHGFWVDSDRSPGTLRPEVGTFIREILPLLK